jgi:poly-gamma-glutamate capsule biosynthesis protein CapA/YwtB (metallophosphatase superfamily)
VTYALLGAIALGSTLPGPVAVASAGANQSPAAAARDWAHARARTTRLAHPITLAWVGDMALSSERGLPPGGIVRALARVRTHLRDADVTAGNLEGTLSVGGASKGGGGDTSTCFAFQAPPSYAAGLRALGFDVVNQANNHALDYGSSAHRQTLAALKKAAVAYTGLPGQIRYVEVGGARVAFLGFAPYSWASNLLDIPGAEAMVRRARAHAALVVVIIHAGAEGSDAVHTPRGSEFYLGEDRGDARAFAHGVVDAGASIVLGSGPHVIRGVERYRGRMIAYSLGDFVGYHTLALGGVLSDSAILRVTLGRGGRVLAARWIPMLLDGAGLPRPDPANRSVRLVSALSREDFPSDHFSIGPHGRFRIPK